MNLFKEIKLKWILGPIFMLFIGYYFIIWNIETYKVGWFATKYDESHGHGHPILICLLIPLFDIILGLIFILPNIMANWNKKITSMKFYYMGDGKWSS